ncbi:Ff.00g087750.m01.CDS01 [Fusarium sp. VM40]|nr:Ff.00g087750.m01.CDS01 [Fusarium sp. VM40]
MSRQYQYHNNSRLPTSIQSIGHVLSVNAQQLAHQLRVWASGPGKRMAMSASERVARRIQRNLTSRRLLSFPHLLVLIWVVALLYGERWVFNSKVASCDWDHWEKWPKDAKPHHLVFVADPQIIDPHSYPGRPWPLNPLTVLVTDNYLRRGYRAMQGRLNPDSLFFLGDLFDGGREWKTREGKFVDPKWGRGRSKDEKKLVQSWHEKYGEDFWLHEYQRFGNIFFKHFNDGGEVPGSWQRGRKLVTSLPGNHDLGFGAQVQVSVRNRFSAFFGDVNRVDVVGNHTLVSVDSVSLSADTSEWKNKHDLKPIYGPVNEFLDGVKVTKRKAVEEELRHYYDLNGGLRYPHNVEELDKSHPTWGSSSEANKGDGPDFPTILLTHVPLYRAPGTPCGPQREHWPPATPPKGQKEPVFPDNRNALSIVGGYQYQNVLNEQDSVRLVKSIGNIKHVFSGDDHDYCEVVHSDAKENVREITVKSMSMAMGVPTPGFQMVSMYNPVDAQGRPLPGAPEQTIQTHLCLLPNQLHTYMQYIIFFVATLVLLLIRAALVPALSLTPFALEPEKSSASAVLPVYKDKMDPPEASSYRNTTSSGTSAHHLPSRLSAAAPRNARSTSPGQTSGRWQARRGGRNDKRWGWGSAGGPRIHLDDNYFSTEAQDRRVGGRKALRVIGRELWTSTWRVAWMAVSFFAYLAWRG